MDPIKIFIGTPIEHASERATLARVVKVLSAKRTPAVILANVNFGGRQIDLAICLDQRVLIVESKGYNSAVRGTENGNWHVRLSTGEWKEIPNLYAQALAEKFALRDAMTAFTGTESPYPNSALVFVPAIPPDSTVPSGDFKVSIGGLDALPEMIASTTHHSWSLDQWRAFAVHHQLIEVSSVDAALNQELLQAEWVLKKYGDAFTRTYGPPTSAMVPIICDHNGKTISSEIVVERPIDGRNVLLIGPSGCGKSLLSLKVALASLGAGCVPIVIPAKDFEGNLRDVANREAALLDARSASAVIVAAQLLDRRILLLVDGYNECAPSERERLTRSISAAVRRYNACAIISTGTTLERSDLLPTLNYTVQAPNMGIKLAIAQQAAEGASIKAFSDLLGTVGSGLEAKLIGQLGQQLPVNTSKYGLFDAYVRERLRPAASDGIRALSLIAGIMTDQVRFGLSVRELDRLLDREGISNTILQTLQAANILDVRGDRVGFSHEMFLNVYAAEAILRRSGDDVDAVVAALQVPSQLETKPFVLEAIDDDHFRRRVLSNLSDTWVVSACLAGQFGKDPQLWANKRCDELLIRIRREIETIRFDISKDFAWNVQAKQETLQQWTEHDRAILAAISHELVNGRRLDEVLDLIQAMDERLLEEHVRLIEEARKQKLGLRSGLYAISYTGFAGRELGLAQICGPVHSGLLYSGPKVAKSVRLFERLRSENLSPGQIGLLVELDKYSDRDAPSIGALLPAILKRLWPQAAHHLRLSLMNTACMSANALNDDERSALIAVIEDLMPASNGFDSTGMIDALKFLGALDDDQAKHVTSVKAQIEAVLENRDDPLMFGVANGLWSAQFDHPYDGAYCEAWSDLSEDDRKALLVMAAQYVDHASMFTPPLIAELASCGDPAAGTTIARWTVLPPKKEVLLQDTVRIFEIAHAALARLHFPLPDRTAEAVIPAEQAFLACGAIIYWLNRDDLSAVERKLNCAGPLSILSRHELGVAAAVIGEFFDSNLLFSESAKRLPGSEPPVTSFALDFPDEIAAIYRAALEQPTLQTGYFEFFRTNDVIENALENLGTLGNSSDIPLLRVWSANPRHGHTAVRAIKAIEKASGRKQQGTNS